MKTANEFNLSAVLRAHQVASLLNTWFGGSYMNGVDTTISAVLVFFIAATTILIHYPSDVGLWLCKVRKVSHWVGEYVHCVW